MNEHKSFLPHLSIDSVIFGFDGTNLNVLLLRIKEMDKWSLPGGFVRSDESLDDAACRILRERTRLEDIFLEQYHTFGSTGRDNSEIVEHLFRMNVITDEFRAFVRDRFISIGYYALVKQREADISSDLYAMDTAWRNVRDLPLMALDHGDMIHKALDVLRNGLNNRPVGLNLLPEKFTMTEIQQLYEAILGQPLDRRNFARKVNRFNILKKLNERRSGVAHKSPQLYAFDETTYNKALKEGLSPMW